MRKLNFYRIVMRGGRTICLVTVAGFSFISATTSPSSAYFFHPDTPTIQEYYHLDSPQPSENTAGKKEPSPSPNSSDFTSPFKSPPATTEAVPPVYIAPSAQTPPKTPSQPLKIVFPPPSPQTTEQSAPPVNQPLPPAVSFHPILPLDPSLGPLNAASTLPVAAEMTVKETYIINFNNVGIIEYIRFISKISNTNFLFQEADLQFNVTIISEEPTTIDDIMSALIQILRIHGLSLMEQGNNLVISKTSDISRIATVITDDQESFSPIITRVIRLNYISPEKMRAIIQPMLSSQALIEVSSETRHLIITDVSSNIDKVLVLLQSLDVSHSSIDIATYLTQYTSASTLLNLAQQILAPIALAEGAPITLVPQSATNTIFIVSTPELISRTMSVLQALDKPAIQENQALPRSSAIEIQSYNAINVTPAALIPLAERILTPIAQAENVMMNIVQQPGTNTIFIISTPELIQRALIVLRSLDQGAPQPIPGAPDLPPPPPPAIPSTDMEGTVLYLYKLQYLKGEKIEIAMQDIGASLAKTGLSNADLVSTINSMQWIEPNNSLLFVGTPASIEKIKEFLRVLDKPLRQVFLEVLVIETTLANSMNFGVQWGINGINGETLFGNSGLFDNSNTFAPNFVFPQVNNIPGVVQPSLPLQQGFNFGVIGDLLTHNGNVFASIGALLKALQTEAQTKILLNPKVVTEDNNTAQIFVGQNIPFTTANVQIQAANNSTGFNVDYRDVGILLEVTPYLGSNDIVTLDLHQEINFLDTTNSGSTATPNSVPNNIQGFPIPTTNKILTSTRVHVPHNYFLIISGHINDQKTYTRAGLPCLGCLPVVGSAFSQQASAITKQNIIIFIHPKIIDTRYDIAEITDEQGCDFERHSEAHYQGHKTPCGRYLKEPPCKEPVQHPKPRYPIGYCPGPDKYPDYPCNNPKTEGSYYQSSYPPYPSPEHVEGGRGYLSPRY